MNAIAEYWATFLSEISKCQTSFFFFFCLFTLSFLLSLPNPTPSLSLPLSLPLPSLCHSRSHNSHILSFYIHFLHLYNSKIPFSVFSHLFFLSLEISYSKSFSRYLSQSHNSFSLIRYLPLSSFIPIFLSLSHTPLRPFSLPFFAFTLMIYAHSFKNIEKPRT